MPGSIVEWLCIPYYSTGATTVAEHGDEMAAKNELSTITSTLGELATRISALVENEGPSLEGDVYTELVAAERTVGTLLRRLQRVARRLA